MFTNFPNGVSSFGVPVLGSGPVFTTGSVFFVGNAEAGASDGNLGTDPRRPLSTIGAALDKCGASRNDVILVMPGHVESITATTLNLDVAGVSIIGIGNKRNRPRLSLNSSTGARINVNAANVLMDNFWITGDIDAITIGILVNQPDFTLRNFTYTDVTGEIAIFLQAQPAGDRCQVYNFEYNGSTAAGTTSAINNKGSDNLWIYDFIADGNFSTGFINCAAASTEMRVWNCWSFRTRNAADIFVIDTATGSSGQIGPNLNLRLQDNAANITEACTGATFVYMQPINIVNLAGESSMQTNITASTDA